MTASNALTAIAVELAAIAEPLDRVVRDPDPPHELLALLRRAGWIVPGMAEVDHAALIADLETLIATLEELPSLIRSGSLSDLADTLDATAASYAALHGLASTFADVLDLTDLAIPATAPGALAADVASVVVLQWLAARHPVLYGVLQALHVVAVHDVSEIITAGGDVLRRAGPARRLTPEAVPALLSDPLDFLRNASGFVDGITDTLDAQVLPVLLGGGAGALASSVGMGLTAPAAGRTADDLDAELQEPSRRTLAARLHLPRAPETPQVDVVDLEFLFLSPDDRGELALPGPGFEIRLGGLAPITTHLGSWALDLAVPSAPLVAFVGPQQVLTDTGAPLEVSATLSRVDGGGLVLGADHGTRLELASPHLTLEATFDADAEVPADIGLEVVLPSSRLVVTTGDGDAFIAGVLGHLDLDVSFDLGVAWSRSQGLRLSGSHDVALRLPLDVPVLGLLTVEVLELVFDPSGTSLRMDLRLDVSFVLGPFEARVEGLGLRITLDLASEPGNVGVGDLAILFLPPTLVEFEVALGDALNGGGFVAHDPDTGRWTGALDLQVLCIDLGAIVVVDTQLPDDPDGWALFASLFLTFPSVPLGFGFFLSGVGGIVCLHRTMDTLAIAAGLREGVVDTLLFPDDPINDAPAIIAQLDAWFPLAQGATVIAVAATITWGTPETVVTGQLAIAVVLPDLEIVVLGSIALILPEGDDPLLELHLDTLGAYDSSDQTLLVVASLYDSTLLGTIDLSGDMAMYSRFGSDPYFLLSVGGYHPEFRPPGDVPAAVLDLRRIRVEVTISDDTWYALETYVAVTSNTFQFGAAATLEASTRFLGVTYTARGHIGFDVLLQFSPFAFVVSFTAGVAVTSGSSDNELLAVSLDARLEGPRPWYATGTASFKFLGIKVSFDVAVGGSAPAEARPREHVLDRLVDALETHEAWVAILPDTDTVRLAEGVSPAADGDATDPTEPPLRVRPDGRLVASQTVAPLNRSMDVYGTAAIDGPDRITVTDAGITGLGTATWSATQDWFAPALYDEMSRAERLASQSFERMDAGVEIVVGGVAWGDQEQVLTPDYEVAVITEVDDDARPLGTRRQLVSAAALLVEGRLDPAVTGARRRNVSGPPPLRTQAAGWLVGDATTGVAVSRSSSQRRARARLAQRQPPGTGRADLRIVPAHAAREAA